MIKLDTPEERQRAATELAYELSRMPVDAARRQVSQILRKACDCPDPVERRHRLDFNARLCTALRELKVPIWGRED